MTDRGRIVKRPIRLGSTGTLPAFDERSPRSRYAAGMELRGPRVVLRRTQAGDSGALSAILATPEVARWWPSFDLPRVEKELTGGDDDVEVYAILLDGRIVGAIQSHEENDPEFRYAGIDVFIAPDMMGAGIGPEAIRTLARFLIDERGHHRITIDPAAANERAIRAYEKVGFRRVGVMRAYQRFPDGTWQDALLMELLADELRD